MPVLYIYSPAKSPPVGLLDRVCAECASFLSIPSEHVWAFWLTVPIENARRPGWTASSLDAAPPTVALICRETYSSKQVENLLTMLRDIFANEIGCNSDDVFVAVQRVAPQELLARGQVWMGGSTSGVVAPVALVPVGVVRSDIEGDKEDGWGSIVSSIEIDRGRYGPESLAGLAQFSHIEIIFLLDRVSPDQIEIGARHPRERTDWPIVGIFSQRAKSRPNRLGLSCCRLLAVKDTTLIVEGLDAYDGSPVLDVKPYFPQFGPRSEIGMPEWASELMATYF